MTTTTIVIGEAKRPKNVTPIKFERVLNSVGAGGVVSGMVEAISLPSDYAYIELVCKNYQPGEGNDMMFAYNDPEKRGDGMLYIGSWNDGVVE